MASSAIPKLIVAFTLAVFSVAGSAQCNLDKQTAKMPSTAQHPAPGPNYTAWLNQDVRWIITDEERASFKRLRSDVERDQFIEQFWLRRDPTPETFLNEFKQEHYRRMLYANENFATDDTPGWKTDRGRIHIAYGRPDEVISTNQDREQGEIWRYRFIFGIGQNVEVQFANRCRCGDFQQLGEPQALDSNGRSACIDRVISPLGTVPAFQFRDLDEIVTHKICMTVVPMNVFTGQVKVTDYTVLVPITVSVQHENVTWSTEAVDRRKSLNLYGRITSQTGRIEDIFEGTIKRNSEQAGEDFTYLYTAPLRSGTYRINVAVKDVEGDRKGTWSGTINVR